MPRPNLPPTPGSSSEIRSQDGTHQLTPSHLAFELPPPAMPNASRVSPSDKPSAAAVARSKSSRDVAGPLHSPALSNIHPDHAIQASEAVKSRRRTSTAQNESKGDSFALPPPPTRSRKIIQMKPGPQQQADPSSTAKGARKTAIKNQAAPAKETSASASGTSTATGSKKKQAGATTAAGRKIARKTAHSLIERRRRSKMNEEFAVLKNMIPACTGEMHKLAILQASIEYVRYLEDCVVKLKEQHQEATDLGNGPSTTLPSIHEFHPTFQDDSGDIEMTDSEAATSPTCKPTLDHQARYPSVSPALQPLDARQRQHSYSSAPGNADQRHYSYSTSASPNFGPQGAQGGWPFRPTSSASGSTLNSPALGPQSDVDQEVTAALLMLNSDRREATSSTARDGGRGLSVRDLLSS